MTKMSHRELRFLIFFLPIFALKLMNITADNKILVVVSMACFVLEMAGFINEKMPKIEIFLLGIVAIYTATLVITCGKQGAFFSAVMVLGLYKVDPRKVVYRCCFCAGIVFVLISSFIEREGNSEVRYINGNWTIFYKRSNILFISFFVVLCLYLYLQKEDKISLLKLLFVWLSGYVMYRYTGSRTGLLVLDILVVMLFLLANKRIYCNKVVRLLCVNSPIIGFALSFLMSFSYNKIPMLYKINNMLQGRLELGHRYLNVYNVKLFGQHIFEDFSANNYWCLDCAYLDMLLCYGVVFSLLWLVLTRNVLKWLYQENRYIEIATIIAYSVYGISETFLPNGFLNISIFLYAEYVFNHALIIRKKRFQRVRR